MSKYSENYTKIYSGFVKIISCIDSCMTSEQTTVAAKMTTSWLGLVDHYCDQVWFDKSDKRRKYNANSLSDAARMMFEDINSAFKEKVSLFVEPEYEASFKPCHIKDLREIVHEYNDEYAQGYYDVNEEEIYE